MAGHGVKAKQTAKKPGKLTNYAIPADVFVEAWEGGANIHETFATLKTYSQKHGTPVMPHPIIAARAAEYRKAKVPLKMMPRVSSRNLDANALTAVVAKVRAEKGAKTENGADAVLTRAQVEEVVVEVLRKYGLVK